MFYKHCSNCSTTYIIEYYLVLWSLSNNRDSHSLMAFLSLPSHITFKARPSIMEEALGKIM